MLIDGKDISDSAVPPPPPDFQDSFSKSFPADTLGIYSSDSSQQVPVVASNVLHGNESANRRTVSSDYPSFRGQPELMYGTGVENSPVTAASSSGASTSPGIHTYTPGLTHSNFHNNSSLLETRLSGPSSIRTSLDRVDAFSQQDSSTVSNERRYDSTVPASFPTVYPSTGTGTGGNRHQVYSPSLFSTPSESMTSPPPRRERDAGLLMADDSATLPPDYDELRGGPSFPPPHRAGDERG